jgi:hypothetical protein
MEKLRVGIIGTGGISHMHIDGYRQLKNVDIVSGCDIDSGANLGFEVIKGCSIWTMDPMSESRKKKAVQKIEKCSERFYRNLLRDVRPVPSFFRLMLFRTTRSGLQYRDKKSFDYTYYPEKGWFQSDYYYETRLGPIKKWAGHFFDFLGRRFGNSL